jgi:PAS domain S-box-containing protein
LKLLSKALFFVTALLLLQLGLLVAFGVLFSQAEKEARAAEKSKLVVVEGTSITQDLYDGGAALSAYAVLRNKELKDRYAQCMNDLEKRIATLEDLAAANPEDKERLHAIAGEALDVFGILKEAQPTLDGQDGAEKFVKVERMARTVHPKLRLLVDHVDQLVDKHRRIEEIGLDSQRRTRKLFVVLLALVTVSDMAVALAVVVSFSRGITDRLNILADNAGRLSRSQALHPPVPGKDEISQLDKAFHDMAQALFEATARERVLLNKMPGGIIACDSSGGILYINPRTEELIGYHIEDLINQHITTVLEGFENHPRQQAMRMLNDLTDNKVSEFKVRRKDGQVFPAEISLARVLENEQTKLIYNMMDVTHRHEVERLKREFLSIVSHDLKTPLSSIRGCISTVLRGADGKLDKEWLNLLSSGERESDRLIRLVADLLDVARLEAGRMKIDLTACPLAEVFDKAVKSVALTATHRNISISADAQGLSAIADPDRAVQVLVNLLSNALKYSPPDSKIRVLARPHQASVMISVEDQGRGVPAQSLETIFEKYEQTRREDQAQGSGLGLAICKLIVENMGGTIGATSKEGVGSTFWFTLPAAKVAHASDANVVKEDVA